ncbi:MAG: CO dehydrogenase/CO-methylating acetyl-CoA synthase complex subunit beta [Candidatus Aenigmarchaeota archaeon]|nr:CO dehydrogenase/CO-methylating acetyl-CoA synthase complex subunit beta [Candidatus Aenigmarchaeota archaeon]
MFADIPVDVGVVYEGERIRKPKMHVELGGPKVSEKFELLRIISPEKVEDGKIVVLGSDVQRLEEGSSIPFGIYVEVAGKELEVDMEGVMERRLHDFCNYIEGFMHLNQRNSIWLRMDKKAVSKGLTLEIVGKVLQRLFKSEMPIIEKIQITFLTDPKEVEKRYQDAIQIYEKRDARVRGMTDKDVDVFYGCTLCQSFAPTHVCVISPQRYANCGAISWLDGRAAAKVDPKGPIFAIDKDDCLDVEAGEYEGANRVISEKTLGEIERVQLYTAFGYPHTSCGCFEATTFYVPEVDGMGIVHRDFTDSTPSGLSFGAIADSTAGGRQVDGFHGLSLEYMKSPKFLQVDNGWNRIVWLPLQLKDVMKEYIPKELFDKIPTEKDVQTVEELKDFLKDNNHPIVERWKEEEVITSMSQTVTPEHTQTATPPLPQTGILQEISQPSTVTPSLTKTETFTFTFKNVKISAERLIIRKKEG